MKYLYYLVVPLLLLPQFIFAQRQTGNTNGNEGQPTGGTVELENPLGEGSTLIGLFETILGVIMVFAVPLIVFFIIYAGFLYVTAQGNESTISKAHKALLYALIGGLIILGANVLIDVIQGTVEAVAN